MHTTEDIKLSFAAKMQQYFRPMAVVWIILACVLGGLYYSFILDYHAARLIEKNLSELLGTDVKINKVNLSLSKGELSIQRVQIFHPSITTKNLYEIDNVNGHFLRAPLLRKQLVFDTVTLKGISYLSPREEAVSFTDEEVPQTSTQKYEDNSSNLFTNINIDYAKSPLKHLAQLSTGLHTRELIDEQMPHLESSVTVDQIQRDLATLESSVDNTLRNTDKQNNSRVREAKELITKAHTTLSAKINDIDKSLQNDTTTIRKKLGLPETNNGTFAPIIFGPKTLYFLEQFGQWVEYTRKKMPTRSGPIGKSYVLQVRPRGKSVHFPYLSGYPSLLIQNLKFESNSTGKNELGNVEGVISGVTTDPYILGHTTVGELKLSFPSQGLGNTTLKFEIDHTGDEPKEILQLEADSLILKNTNISKITDLSLDITKGESSLKMNAELTGRALKASGAFKSKDTEFKVTSPYRNVEDYIQSLLIPFYEFELDVAVEGTVDNLKLTLNTSLDSKLTSGLNDEIKRQISAVEATIHENLANRFMPKKHDFLDRLDKMKRLDLQTIQSVYLSNRQPAKKSD